MNFWASLPNPFYCLAPMEDVTDTVFRRLIGSCGEPHVYFSEFTSTDGMLSKGADKVTHRLLYTEDERPLVAQIWGNNPENYRIATQKLIELGFDGVDINMGCPVEKIVKNGCCSALIDNPTLAKELYLAAKQGATEAGKSEFPVSIKTRIGFRTKVTEQWAETLLGLNPAVITVHGRTAKQLSKGMADWSEIAKFVDLRNEQKSSTLIVGNGDVKSLDEADSRVDETGVDGVMIGRGIFENLFLFDRDATPLLERSAEEKLNLLLKHVESFEKTWNDVKPSRILKKYYKIYAAGFRGASQLRMALVETESSDEVRERVREFLSSYDPSSDSSLSCGVKSAA